MTILSNPKRNGEHLNFQVESSIGEISTIHILSDPLLPRVGDYGRDAKVKKIKEIQSQFVNVTVYPRTWGYKDHSGTLLIFKNIEENEES